MHRFECAGYWRYTPSFHRCANPLVWSGYYTGLQFTAETWARANRLLGRHDSPTTGNARIIVLHAYAIVTADGGSWREWPTSSRSCGLR